MDCSREERVLGREGGVSVHSEGCALELYIFGEFAMHYDSEAIPDSLFTKSS